MSQLLDTYEWMIKLGCMNEAVVDANRGLLLEADQGVLHLRKKIKREFPNKTSEEVKQAAIDFRDYFHLLDNTFNPVLRVMANIAFDELGYLKRRQDSNGVEILRKINTFLFRDEETVLKKLKDDIELARKSNGKIPDPDFNYLFNIYDNQVYEAFLHGESGDGGELVKNENYEIIKIPDYKTAHEWGKWTGHQGDGTPSTGQLCFTTGAGTWDGYSDHDQRTCWLALRNDWKEVRPMTKEQIDRKESPEYPKDDYGLSMVWFFVDPRSNKITDSNVRWNHGYGGYNADEMFSPNDLQKLLGRDISEFGIVNKILAIKEAMDRLASGENWKDIFDLHNRLYNNLTDSYDFISVTYKSSGYNIINIAKNELVWKDRYEWFSSDPGYHSFNNGYCPVKLGRGYNLIDENGNLLWKKDRCGFDDMNYFIKGTAIVGIWGKGRNVINGNGDLLWNPENGVWFQELERSDGGTGFNAIMEKENWSGPEFNKWKEIAFDNNLNTILGPDGEPIRKLLAPNEKTKTVVAKLNNGKLTYLDESYKPMFADIAPDGFNQISPFANNGWAAVSDNDDGCWYYINLNGDRMYNGEEGNYFEEANTFVGDYAKVATDGYYFNILRSDGQLMWNDNEIRLEDVTIRPNSDWIWLQKYDDEPLHNLMKKSNGKLLLPNDKWADVIRDYDGSLSRPIRVIYYDYSTINGHDYRTYRTCFYDKEGNFIGELPKKCKDILPYHGLKTPDDGFGGYWFYSADYPLGRQLIAYDTTKGKFATMQEVFDSQFDSQKERFDKEIHYVIEPVSRMPDGSDSTVVRCAHLLNALNGQGKIVSPDLWFDDIRDGQGIEIRGNKKTKPPFHFYIVDWVQSKNILLDNGKLLYDGPQDIIRISWHSDYNMFMLETHNSTVIRYLSPNGELFNNLQDNEKVTTSMMLFGKYIYQVVDYNRAYLIDIKTKEVFNFPYKIISPTNESELAKADACTIRGLNQGEGDHRINIFFSDGTFLYNTIEDSDLMIARFYPNDEYAVVAATNNKYNVFDTASRRMIYQADPQYWFGHIAGYNSKYDFWYVSRNARNTSVSILYNDGSLFRNGEVWFSDINASHFNDGAFAHAVIDDANQEEVAINVNGQMMPWATYIAQERGHNDDEPEPLDEIIRRNIMKLLNGRL